MEYRLYDIRLMKAVMLPLDGQIGESITETNKSFKMWYDEQHRCRVVECDHPPQNRPLYGIIWSPKEQENAQP